MCIKRGTITFIDINETIHHKGEQNKKIDRQTKNGPPTPLSLSGVTVAYFGGQTTQQSYKKGYEMRLLFPGALGVVFLRWMWRDEMVPIRHHRNGGITQTEEKQSSQTSRMQCPWCQSKTKW